MKEYFEDSIKRLNSEIAELEKKQIERNERLREIEDENNKSGFHVPNPVKAIKQKEEAKRISKALSADEEKLKELREELESCEEELMKIETGLALNERSRKRLIPILSGAAVLLIGIFIVGGMFLGNNKKEEDAIAAANNEPSQVEPSQEDPTRAITVEEEKSERVSDVSTVKEAVVEQSAANHSTDESMQVIEKSNSSDTEKLAIVEEDVSTAESADDITEGMLKLTNKDLSIQYIRDYGHVSNDSIYLGNDEGLTITVDIAKGNVALEDLIFDADDSLINIDVSDPIYEIGKTRIEAYVTASGECNTDIWIGTNYEVLTKGDDAMWCNISVVKLNSEDGRVVYVTPTGDKYHYSSGCAGENAYATTYYDVSMLEMEPCGNCAK